MVNKRITFPILSLCVALMLFSGCKGKFQTADRYADLPVELAAMYKERDKKPSEASVYVKLSDYFLQHSLLDSSLNNILIAIRLDSNNAHYYLKLSDVYFAMKNIDESEEILEKVVGMDNQNQEAHLKLAELQLLFKRYKEAHQSIENVLDIDYLNPKAFFIQGWIFKEEGDTSAAIRSYLRAAEQDPNYFDAYEELAILYHRKHNPIAVDYYRNALNVQPENLQTMYNLAMFYQETGNDQKAIEQYKMMLQLDPYQKYALHNIGWIYLQRENKYEEAVAFFTKAIEADSTFIEAIFNRGFAFEQLGNYAGARQDYMYSLKLNHNYELGIEGLNRLDKLEK